VIKLFNEDVLNVDFEPLPAINLVVTSPPYNVGIEYDKHDDTMDYYDYLKWCGEWINVMYNVMADDGRLCINIPFSITPVHLNKKKGAEDINYPVAADYTRIAQEYGFKYYRTVIWQKLGSNKTCWGSWRSARSPFIIDPNECILIFYKEQWRRKEDDPKGKKSSVRGREFMTYVKNLWNIHPETQSKHPAAFPLELPNRCIKLLSYKHDVVCDPFLGSGTTGEAAVRLGRSFVGIEKSEEYFKMAKERIDTAELQTSLIPSIMPDGDEDDD